MKMQKVRCWISAAVFFAVVSLPFALIAQAAPESVIQGLGMRMPNAPDVSLNRNFHVYEMEKDGVAYVQINNRNNDIVTAIAMTGDGFSQLPIGYLAANKVLLPRSQQSISQQYGVVAPQAQAMGDGQCPCSGQVVYSGPNGTIIVVSDKNGNVIQVVVLQPKSYSKE